MLRGEAMRYCTNSPDTTAEILGGIEAPQLSGCVRFYQERGCVLIVARISGLPKEGGKGFFGFHIHQGGDCNGTDFPGTGSYYNPHNEALG